MPKLKIIQIKLRKCTIDSSSDHFLMTSMPSSLSEEPYDQLTESGSLLTLFKSLSMKPRNLKQRKNQILIHSLNNSLKSINPRLRNKRISLKRTILKKSKIAMIHIKFSNFKRMPRWIK